MKVTVKGRRKSAKREFGTSSIKPSSPTTIDNRDHPSPLTDHGVVPGFVTFNERYLSMIRTGG